MSKLKYIKLITPKQLIKSYTLSNKYKKLILNSINNIKNILDGKNSRKIIITGPCSIHDFNQGVTYAKKLKKLSNKVNDKLLLVMRTYFEKPRTNVGWEGFIYDPILNNSYDLNKGLKLSRKLLIKITEIGIPSATELLDPLIHYYISDLISWTGIGARTTESQIHRRMASALSIPVGFKNSIYGEEFVAINAIKSASIGHTFPGIDKYGIIKSIESYGNPYSHLVLRGYDIKPNYFEKDVKRIQKKLELNNLNKNIIIDCSHGNSYKNHKLQPKVFRNVFNQIKQGNKNIIGVMLESNLKEGNQKLNNPKKLKYGVSITDSCIDWKTTENLILEGYEKIS